MTTIAAGAEEPGEDFSERIEVFYRHTLLTYMMDLGHRTGLFEAAALGPATSAELAARASLNERYVRQWLGSMVTEQIVDYDPDTGRYTLPPEHADALTGIGQTNAARGAHSHVLLGRTLDLVADAFRNGGGVPYSEFGEFRQAQDDANFSPDLRAWLIDELLPRAPGLLTRLQDGARVADVGCGGGALIVALAGAFPNSAFVGFDYSEADIGRARASASAAHLANATFEVADVAELTISTSFDAVICRVTIHDQADPVAVLTGIREALVPGGVLLMNEPHPPDRLEEFAGNRFASYMFAHDVLHCMTVSLAYGGVGTGCATFTEEVVRSFLDQAGFTDVEVHPDPGEFPTAVYVVHKAA